jgi:DNA polymerase alpha subunit A
MYSYDIGNGLETENQVDMADVYTEVSELCSIYRITKFASKEVTRKYAFELHDVPAEANYLKVLYDYERK